MTSKNSVEKVIEEYRLRGDLTLNDINSFLTWLNRKMLKCGCVIAKNKYGTEIVRFCPQHESKR